MWFSCMVSLLSTILFCLFVLLSLGVASTSGVDTAGASTATDNAAKGTDVFMYITLVMGLLGLAGTSACAYMLCYLQKRAEEVAFIIREATVAIRAVPGILFLPLIPIMVLLTVAIGWLFATIEFLSQTDDDLYGGGQYLFAFLFSVEVVGMAWVVGLISGVADGCTAGSICKWYWSKPGDLKVVEQDELSQSFSRMRQHWGTVSRVSHLPTHWVVASVSHCGVCVCVSCLADGSLHFLPRDI